MKKYCIEGFFKVLNENAELKRKFGEIRSKYRKIQLSKEESAEFLRKELIPFARNLGFNFNEIDYIEYQREKELEPLKDEELEMVSGGAGFFSAKTLGLAALSFVLFSAPSMSNLNPFVSNKAEASSQAQAAVLNDEYRENGLAYRLETDDENGANIATVIRAENIDDVVVIPRTISAGGRDFTVEAIGRRAFGQSNAINITIPDSVKIIEEGAFINCENLASVNFGENSELKSIGSRAFSLSNIKDIIIPSSVETIERYAFADCKNLNSVNFGEDSQLNVIEEFAFLRSSIENINIPDFVEAIKRGAFEYCKNLYSVDFGENSRLNSIEDSAFHNSGIRRIWLPKTLEVIGDSAFKESALQQIICTPGSIQTIGMEAFKGCRNLNYLEGFEKTNLREIGNNAFSDCDNLEGGCFPASLERIGKGAFLRCHPHPEAGGFTFESYNPNIVSSLDDVFDKSCIISVFSDNIRYTLKCNEQGEQEVSVAGTHKIFTNNVDDPFQYGMNETVRIKSEISLGGKQYKVTSIAKDAFRRFNAYVLLISGGHLPIEDYVDIKNVIIPASIKTIGKGAFKNCLLNSVRFEDNSELETIEESAFSHCTELRNISFGENSRLNSIGTCAFSNSGIGNITVPDSVETIRERAFEGCRNLISINFGENSKINPVDFENLGPKARRLSAISNGEYRENGIVYKLETNDENGTNIATVIRAENTDDVVVIPGTISAGGRDFTVEAIGCRAFEQSNAINITIPDSVKIIEEGAFINCKIASVNFGENSELKSIGSRAFSLSNIKDITIPSSVETIERYAFADCKNLNSVNFRENSQLDVMGEFAFLRSSIKNITIPDSIEAIKAGTFENCKNLDSVKFGRNSRLNSIEYSAFHNSGIRRIWLPETLEFIGNSAFKESALQDINIPASVQTIGIEAFKDCRALHSLNFKESWNRKSVLKVIGANAFDGCNELRNKVAFPASLERIGKEAFLGCPVKGFSFESYNPNLIAQISDTAFNRKSEISVVLDNIEYTLKYNKQGQPEASVSGTHKLFDDDKSEINYEKNETIRIRNEISLGGKQYKVTSISEKAFNYSYSQVALKYKLGCYGAGAIIGRRDIIIPASVKTIGKRAFEQCRGLTSVKFEDNSDLETIEESAFRGCTELKNISFGENSKLKTICSNAINCSAMENLDIPASVTKIEGNAISGIWINLARVSRPFMTVNFLGDPGLIDISPDAGQELRDRFLITLPTRGAPPRIFAEEEAYRKIRNLYNDGYGFPASNNEEIVERLLAVHSTLQDEEDTENEKYLIKGLFTLGISLGLSPEASAKIWINNSFVDQQLAFETINEKIDSTPVLLSMGAKDAVAAIERQSLAESCILLARHSIIIDSDFSDHKVDGNLEVPEGAEIQELLDENSPGKIDFLSFRSDLFLDSHDSPSPADIRQGRVGDCYFLSALGAVLVKNPQIILNSIKDDGQGNVIVRFYHKDIITNRMVPDYYKVKKTFPTKTGAVNSAHWVRIFEKAYVAHAAKYTPNRRMQTTLTSIKKDSYRLIEGTFRTHVAMSHICGSTGNKAEVIKSDLKRLACTDAGQIRQPGDYENEVLSFFENSIKEPFESGTALSFTAHVSPAGSDTNAVAANVFDHHAYAVMGILPNQRTQSGKTLNLIKLRNPWGHTIPHYVKDKDGKWELKENTQPQDGVFTLDLNQLIQTFDTLHSCKTK